MEGGDRVNFDFGSNCWHMSKQMRHRATIGDSVLLFGIGLSLCLSCFARLLSRSNPPFWERLGSLDVVVLWDGVLSICGDIVFPTISEGLSFISRRFCVEYRITH